MKSTAELGFILALISTAIISSFFGKMCGVHDERREHKCAELQTAATSPFLSKNERDAAMNGWRISCR